MRFHELTPFLKGRLPGQLVIQYVSHCNADCPQCGMRRSNSLERSRLDKGLLAVMGGNARKYISSRGFEDAF